MSRLCIMSNYRKLCVILAGLAALFVLSAGGANATNPVTIRCVPSHTINAACSPTDYATIQAAVTAATTPDVILVASGTYNESVSINGISRNGISLAGAQAGNDARVDRHDATKESVVNGGGSIAFDINAPYVAIDGFTVEGGSPGIYVESGIAGLSVINNIIKNNNGGISLSSGVSLTKIERNLFETNLMGIVSNAPDSTPLVSGLIITENGFTGHGWAAMIINYTTGAAITSNTSEKDASFVFMNATTNSEFDHNRGKKFGQAVLPGYLGDAAIDVGPGNTSVEIGYNELEGGEAPVDNGIAFTNAFGSGTSQGMGVIGNKITHFPENGIVAESETLDDSSIAENKVYDSGMDGIFIDGTIAANHGNVVADNYVEGSSKYDCEDDTGPGGTGILGTYTLWINNLASTSFPPGLCSPVTLRHHD